MDVAAALAAAFLSGGGPWWARVVVAVSLATVLQLLFLLLISTPRRMWIDTQRRIRTAAQLADMRREIIEFIRRGQTLLDNARSNEPAVINQQFSEWHRAVQAYLRAHFEAGEAELFGISSGIAVPPYSDTVRPAIHTRLVRLQELLDRLDRERQLWLVPEAVP